MQAASVAASKTPVITRLRRLPYRLQIEAGGAPLHRAARTALGEREQEAKRLTSLRPNPRLRARRMNTSRATSAVPVVDSVPFLFSLLDSLPAREFIIVVVQTTDKTNQYDRDQ